MSFLFNKKSKKVIKYAWSVLAILIAISMVLLFSPGLIPSGGASTVPSHLAPTTPNQDFSVTPIDENGDPILQGAPITIEESSEPSPQTFEPLSI